MCKRVDIVCSVSPTLQSNMNKFLLSKGIDFSILSSEDKIRLVNKLEMCCKSCELRYEGRGTVPSRLRVDSQYVFIGRNPNLSDTRTGVLFDTAYPQGSMFQQYVRYLGLGDSEYSIINMCSCSSRNNSPITPQQVNQCSCLTKMALDSLPNMQVIFPMSKDAITWILGKTVDNMQVLGEFYISTYNNKEVLIVPLPHPSVLMTDRDMIPTAKTILTNIHDNIIRKE